MPGTTDWISILKTKGSKEEQLAAIYISKQRIMICVGLLRGGVNQ
jgi:hypothetical protein